jgi:hypothetical protein
VIGTGGIFDPGRMAARTAVQAHATNINGNTSIGACVALGRSTVSPVTGFQDSMGNLVAPDPSVQVYTGHLQQWFGGSFNNRNFVNHDTINFTGTGADGSSFAIHLVNQLGTSAVVTAAPVSFDIGRC